eukprot:GGOE01018209.1.p1 GENE.GGOE01018209.1~~GGOE01018209.1.p1  ORF type:complete len:238 (-),score=23.08 GGOE01018209.1:374-1087(-)
MYQEVDMEGPHVAANFPHTIVSVIAFVGAFLGTLLIASISSPFSNKWAATPTIAPSVPHVVLAHHLNVLQASPFSPLLAQLELEKDPGADVEWIEDDMEDAVDTNDKSLNFAVFMATKIRLTRKGRRKVPFYRMVVADSRMPRDGRFIEIIGTYNPLKKKDDPERVNLNAERVSYWLGVGAQPSETVSHIFERAGLRLPPWLTKRLEKEKAIRQIAIDKYRKEQAKAAKAAAGATKK